MVFLKYGLRTGKKSLDLGGGDYYIDVVQNSKKTLLGGHFLPLWQVLSSLVCFWESLSSFLFFYQKDIWYFNYGKKEWRYSEE